VPLRDDGDRLATGRSPAGDAGTVRPMAATKGPGRRAPRKAAPGDAEPVRTVARNRRARHEYDILETFECGIVLQGSEVKSLRAGRVTLADAYARVEGGELWLLGVHIPPYEHAAGFGAHEPERRRKLLLHRGQIDELTGRTQQQSLTLVPLSIYFKDGKAKLELALARGRRLYDKRHAIARRDAEREAAREARSAAGKGVARGASRQRD
jgi:SsrA-binding protein